MKIKVITNAWIDRKTRELFELSTYTDEKGWVVQSISRVKANEFIRQLLSELPDETTELKKKILKLEEDIDLLKDVAANPGGLL
ncbi:unnamed protein product [marine sediment metagenome]|uniref:Uncharacterized protein n=1 Tax=marine sediment metagenome TaxID=412755 RepID=X1B978_9ZZZZ